MSTLTRRRSLALGLMILAGLSLAGAGYYLWSRSAPPMPETVEEARVVMTSNRYARLPDERKAAYQQRFTQLLRDLPDDQRPAVREQIRSDPAFETAARDARRAEFMSRIREWWQAPEAERDAILDRQLEEWESRRRNRPPAGGNNTGQRPPRADDNRTEEQRAAERTRRQQERRDRMEDRISSGNPQEQAMISEYFRSLRERRSNRS